ncbi:MAG: protein kinase domain-containing protein [Micromonosporaceae bacterium]
MTETPRTLADRYDLTSCIGRGGMGEVWAAYDKRLDRVVAVKLLRADALPTGADRVAIGKRFVRESRLTARVEHPGVPAVFDAGAEGGRLYLVMQLVPGIDLARLIAERAPLAIDSAAAVAAQIVAVLAAAHAVSLVHRDLKPRNVMIRPDGTVVVLDFGVAALMEPDVTRLTITGETLGSPAYMSPEQIVGGVPSPRSDLYAIGCILHEMLAGTRPFLGDGSFTVMRQHFEESPPGLRSVRSDVPEALERLVLELLAKDPSERPSDAQEVYERLSPFLPVPGGDTGVGQPVDPTRPYRRPYAPRPRADREARRAAPAGDLTELRAKAAELAEAGRFTQAAEILTGLLVRDRPSREARNLRLQLASTLLLGGDYGAALSQYQRLIAEVTPERGADDAEVLAWRIQVAVCLDALGRPDEALDQLAPVLRTQRDRLGRLAPAVVRLRRHVALLQAAAGQTDAAVAALRSLLSDLDGQPPAPEIAEILRRLGA